MISFQSMTHYQIPVSNCQQLSVCDLNHNPVMTTVGERIRAERELRKWTQDELAQKAGIRQSFIGALESGAQKSSAYLPEIAYAMSIQAMWLKTGRGPKSTELDSGTNLTPDERELISGYRSAGQERREDMLDAARKALFHRRAGNE